MSFVVAIDGPAASGKGTIAKALARHFGFAHLDTGLLYRAVGKRLVEEGVPITPERAARAARALAPEGLDPHTLRGDAVARAASEVAAIPAVRQALLEAQRAFARREGGAVLDGRDIGTVVCPDADVKFFLTAAVEARAARRHTELIARGEQSIYARVLQDLRERDARDSGRATAPLRAADDAVRLDTSGMDADEAFAVAMTEIARRSPQVGGPK